jgi:SAM-dependent methyltransferase
MFEGDRLDLIAYLGIACELAARSGLDVGCGTGSFALLASAVGLVPRRHPAQASIDVARAKPGAARVTWHCGTLPSAPGIEVDMAVMTGNVAQVFLTNDDWLAALNAVRDRLVRSGHLVYETRRVEDRAWERWRDSPFEASFTFEGVGLVQVRRHLLGIDLPLVSFRNVYTFDDGEPVISDSTLRFRSDDENRDVLTRAGYRVDDVRGAPDRHGRERVYVAALAPDDRAG